MLRIVRFSRDKRRHQRCRCSTPPAHSAGGGTKGWDSRRGQIDCRRFSRRLFYVRSSASCSAFSLFTGYSLLGFPLSLDSSTNTQQRNSILFGSGVNCDSSQLRPSSRRPGVVCREDHGSRDLYLRDGRNDGEVGSCVLMKISKRQIIIPQESRPSSIKEAKSVGEACAQKTPRYSE